MGLKQQLLKVIEWKDDSRNTLVYRFPVSDRYAIMKGSKLIVNESQAAVFVTGGQIADVFEPGTYTLDTNNLPILTKLLAWKYAFETPHKVDVYFVNTKQFTNIKWGTTNPIMMRDKDFGLIRLRGYGNFSFRVCYPAIFMRELFGTVKTFTTEDIENYLKSMILSTLTDILGESKIAALDLAAKYLELGEMAKSESTGRFKQLGLEVTSVVIQNLSLPPEVEKAMDERTTLGVLGGKLNEYQQYHSTQALRDAAKNPGGGIAGAGINLSAGMALGGMMANTFAGAMQGKPVETKSDRVNCPNCGSEVDAKAKFCSECGQKIVVDEKKISCPKCGAEVKATAKFCPECGQKLAQKCPGCGVEIKGNLKFCPECGIKLS